MASFAPVLARGHQGADAINAALESVKTIPTYTLTTLPDVVANVRKLIYVSNATGGAKICVSDGTNWKILAAIGATVS
jgi:hypothetical protein